MTFAAMNVKMNTLTQVAIIWQTGAIVHILGQVQNVKSPAISAESNYAIIAIQRVMLRAITMQVWGCCTWTQWMPKKCTKSCGYCNCPEDTDPGPNCFSQG